MFSYHPYLNVEALLHITNCSKALSLQNCIYTLTFIKQELGPSAFVGPLTLIMLGYVGCQYCLKCQTSFFINTQRFLLFLRLLYYQHYCKLLGNFDQGLLTHTLFFSLQSTWTIQYQSFLFGTNFVVWIGHHNSTVVDE